MWGLFWGISSVFGGSQGLSVLWGKKEYRDIRGHWGAPRGVGGVGAMVGVSGVCQGCRGCQGYIGGSQGL